MGGADLSSSIPSRTFYSGYNDNDISCYLTVHLFLGGSVVVDLTNDSGFHDSNVVDLTSESPADSSIDSSPVIVVWHLSLSKCNLSLYITLVKIVT